MQYTKVFEVTASPAAALAYIADFRTLTEWEPSVQSATQTSGSGPGEGATYDIMMRFAGRDSKMTYRCAELGQSHALLTGEGDGFTAIDRIDVRAVNAGSEVTYDTKIQLQTRFGRTLEPLISVLFGFNVRRAVKQLRTRLNNLS